MEDICYIKHFARDVLERNGIEVQTIHMNESYIFDHHLRGVLFSDAVYDKFLNCILEKCEENTIVQWTDAYGCRYFVIKDKDHYDLIGPFLSGMVDLQSLWADAHQQGIPASFKKPYLEVMQTIPIVRNDLFLMNFMQSYAVYRFQKEHFHFLEIQDAIQNEGVHEGKGKEFAAHDKASVTKRYETIQKVMAETEKGNTEKALQYLVRFQTIAGVPQYQNALKDTKKWLNILNASLRMSAENAGVHPFYIFRTFESISNEIELMSNSDYKTTFMREMVKSYCKLVVENYQKQYSSLVQNTVVEIQRHYDEEISLSVVAEMLNVNASYLSARFHEETGMKFSEYVHRVRIKKVIQEMQKSKEPLKNIIAGAGFYDLNYFSKLFKRYMGVTPQVYRRGLKNTAE